MQGIERAFSVLRALAAADGSAGVSAVARATGLPKSTVSRILASLDDIGVVVRLDTAGNYAIGPGLAQLAGAASGAGSLRDLCRPYLRDLSAEFEESTGLTVPDGDCALYIDSVQYEGAVQTRDWTGMRFPYHTVAGGLAMMTAWSNRQIEEYAETGLTAYASGTATSRDELMARIVEGRRRGFLWTHSDFDDEINGAAAAIVDADGDAVGAVNMFGPTFRFPGAIDEAEIGSRLAAIAHTIGSRLR